LADPVRGFAVATFGTALTRVTGLDAHDLSTGALCLMVLDSFTKVGEAVSEPLIGSISLSQSAQLFYKSVPRSVGEVDGYG
jgi:hypothetical protein